MATNRPTGPAGERGDGVEVVLTDINPYGSRTLVVERDETSSVAYLCGPGGTVHGAVWLANHGPAPDGIDQDRLEAELPPVAPRANTRHPGGRGPLGALRSLWFEEGDGVALYENDELLAVIPGWADMSRGMPGYSRDALGESPFAWSLEDAHDGLAPRISKARAYWEWRGGDGAWASFQQFVMGHLDRKVGTAGRFWDAGGERMPAVGVTERPPERGREHTILSTVGMSCQRMPTVEQYIDRPDAYARVELAVASPGDARDAARLFLWLGQYPWHSVTWLGHGHTARWYHRPETFPLGSAYGGVMMLTGLPGLPDLSGFSFGGDSVQWLWLVPITPDELSLVSAEGYRAVLPRLSATRLTGAG
ncbi:suppressor of fused domain protein [Streptosporangium sp. NPDC000095]|uniref:suppressor of fused domain protein n=1 Tax=Streptosporangium sp. NPDC000095 TaxID=3366184 RepID=UPI003679BE5F